MVKLSPKGQDECGRHEAFDVAGGLGLPRPPEAGECLVLLCALWGYMLPCFILQWNLPGLFKSEVPVVIFLHTVLKIK